MKQKTVKDYRPNYPRKLIRGAILTTAAAVALTGAAGCAQKTADVPTPEPQPTDELVLDGEIGIEVPTEEPMLEGEPAVEETDDPYTRGEPALQGKIIVPEDTPEP
ncbi:MAG: hypothetical protein IJJ86_06855 [Clostridia bacterium]|nr:hypothetical protein [Clostridia bacterium]